MEKCDEDMKDHVQLAWLKVLARKMKKDEVDIELAKNISWRILKYHRNNDQYNIVVVNAIKVLTQVRVYDKVLDLFRRTGQSRCSNERVPFEFQSKREHFTRLISSQKKY